MPNLHTWLDQLRQERGWSREIAAARARISTAYLFKIEHGLSVPTIDTLAKIVRGYEPRSRSNGATTYDLCNPPPAASGRRRTTAPDRDTRSQRPSRTSGFRAHHLRLHHSPVDRAHRQRPAVRRTARTSSGATTSRCGSSSPQRRETGRPTGTTKHLTSSPRFAQPSAPTDSAPCSGAAAHAGCQPPFAAL
ncbi:helix-turn-helix domain-containing protein [Nocardia africana]|uniref:helix-turn-helix domain-containing protein n=1 Tax=Nocardia africana TaxID=134964 RepID=UPI001D150D71|nr:helix-turn-helix transcriptional regulator [Nocardia africana]